MPLTLPDLDDRRYADLVEEARGLLVTYAPTLTNHNPSDPTVTLVELFAYLTEILLFRINYVTDASRTTFLRLLNGPKWELPAGPGALDAEIRRTVLMLRDTDRAVTPADFEFLSHAADANVVRAHCVPDRNLELTDPQQRANLAPGHVSVVIVPQAGVKPTDVFANVANYLEPRRLLTTRVHVVGPRLVTLRVRVTLRLLPDADSSVAARARTALTAFFDPISGHGGAGWPLGRDVFVSEIYTMLDSLPGVDFVSRSLSSSGSPLEEFVVDDLTRIEHNDLGELVSVSMDADELVTYNPIDTDLTIELPVSS